MILAFNILHLLEDVPQAMQRISELLVPGGYLISTTPCMGETLVLLRFFISLAGKMGIIPQIVFFKISELEGSMTGENFQISEAENLSENPPHRLIVAKKL